MNRWLDSRSHGWLFYEPLSAADWPVLARRVAQQLRNNAEIVDALVLEHFDLPRRSGSARGRSATSITERPPV